jgi:hypothetical protein
VLGYFESNFYFLDKTKVFKCCVLRITLFDTFVRIATYNQTTIDYINKCKKEGVQVILATASHGFYARKVAKVTADGPAPEIAIIFLLE